MPEVKWIKLSVEMFDNRKIKHLRRLPAGNDIVLIWVMLLTMAGRCNQGGWIFLTDSIPYDPNMLADELGFDVNTVELALRALEQLGMLNIAPNGMMLISGWEEHQNIDGMERIREQNRLRKQKQRENARLMSGNVTVTEDSHVMSRDSHATDIDKEEDKDIKNKNKNNKGISAKRTTKFTPPTVEEVKAYCEERRNGIDAQHFVDYYETRGWKVGRNTMKDWKAAVRTWERNDSNVRNDKPDRNTPRAGTENWDWGTVL